MKKTTLKSSKIALSIGMLLTSSVPQVYAAEDVAHSASSVPCEIPINNEIRSDLICLFFECSLFLLLESLFSPHLL
ncbi:hypothetical protein [Paenibacillus sp. NPDC057934]|uniref:hypothetical protein n=1 Tax=Paenibacillus sp. NPDC057934 TaxID=3346282 RepID=UPI0036DA8484